MAKAPEKAERSGEADARQGGAAGCADAPTRSPTAQSGIAKGTAGMGSGTGLAAAAGQFVRPPRRFLRRPQGAQSTPKGFRRSAAARLRRRAGHRARSGAGAGTGLGDDEPARPHADPQRMPKYRAPRRRNRAEADRRSRRLSSMGVAATAQALETAAARGPRRNSRAQAVDAAPPAAPGKIRRRPATSSSSRTSSRRATSRRRSRSWSRASSATTARRCCSASPAPARPSPWRR